VGGACGTHGRGERDTCKVLVAKPEGKRPLRRPRHRWVYEIRMDIRVWLTVCGVDSTGCRECGDEPSGSSTKELVSSMIIIRI
jgi:hypothetical protein